MWLEKEQEVRIGQIQTKRESEKMMHRNCQQKKANQVLYTALAYKEWGTKKLRLKNVQTRKMATKLAILYFYMTTTSKNEGSTVKLI